MSSIQRFRGRIAGWGTTSGTRLVVGRWDVSPFGAFADVMVERPDGERVLLAPSHQVADLVATTYRFDRVEVCPVAVSEDWHVVAGPLEAWVGVGRRTVLGGVLRVVPRRVAASHRTTVLTDPVARVLLRGVRTRGSAGPGRVEHYGATDVHEITGACTEWAGEPLGDLRDVDPPVRFGFGSTPRRPAVTDVVTTIVGR
ncbi:hypothetical protein [Oerskovia paurometabola]|uniref:Uncharacterized protein n=1 Tax=Oerskovia paurometabola TaxID=162170 RepID=A0ABW1XDA4_9CELL|nr:hypothetical protein [Oerskovia paurometabola]MBM7496202.1 hypothetical protein [Oerskovia paurometabola]